MCKKMQEGLHKCEKFTIFVVETSEGTEKSSHFVKM